MELWLDTTDEKIIRDAYSLGLLTGVTTNPSILSKADDAPEIVLERLLGFQEGYVAVQVTADDLPTMLKQAEKLMRLDYSKRGRIIIKIPASGDGFKAMALLKKQGITTLATAVFETKQLIFSALAGASYIAPYFNRIENASGGHALKVLKEMQEIIHVQRYQIKIMAAAIHSSKQLCDCAQLGVGAITIPVPVYQEMMQSSSHVEDSLKKFKEDWQSNKETATSKLFC